MQIVAQHTTWGTAMKRALPVAALTLIVAGSAGFGN